MIHCTFKFGRTWVSVYIVGRIKTFFQPLTLCSVLCETGFAPSDVTVDFYVGIHFQFNSQPSSNKLSQSTRKQHDGHGNYNVPLLTFNHVITALDANSSTGNNGSTVSYTHLDVYKRQTKYRHQLNH